MLGDRTVSWTTTTRTATTTTTTIKIITIDIQFLRTPAVTQKGLFTPNSLIPSRSLIRVSIHILIVMSKTHF